MLDNVKAYRLEEQIGFILRRAIQSHTAIFNHHMIAGLTPTRFAALAKLYEKRHLSQNQLGRHTAMDVATIKGVVDWLSARQLVRFDPDPADARRRLIGLTDTGKELIEKAIPIAAQITEQTYAGLSPHDRRQLKALLADIAQPSANRGAPLPL